MCILSLVLLTLPDLAADFGVYDDRREDENEFLARDDKTEGFLFNKDWAAGDKEFWMLLRLVLLALLARRAKFFSAFRTARSLSDSKGTEYEAFSSGCISVCSFSDEATGVLSIVPQVIIGEV